MADRGDRRRLRTPRRRLPGRRAACGTRWPGYERAAAPRSVTCGKSVSETSSPQPAGGRAGAPRPRALPGARRAPLPVSRTWLQHRQAARGARPLADRIGRDEPPPSPTSPTTRSAFRLLGALPQPGVRLRATTWTRCAARHLPPPARRRQERGERSPDAGTGAGPAETSWAGRCTQPRGNAFIRLWRGMLVDKALRRGVERVTVDVESFRAAAGGHADGGHPGDRTRPTGATWTSCSVSYLCFARPDLGIPIPHVAAAVEFARIPLLGSALQAGFTPSIWSAEAGREDKALTRRRFTDLVRDRRRHARVLHRGSSRSRSRRNACRPAARASCAASRPPESA